jgi:hypothetical protein
LLLEEFSDGGWSDSRDKPHFNPHGEMLDRYHNKIEIALSRR